MHLFENSEYVETESRSTGNPRCHRPPRQLRPGGQKSCRVPSSVTYAVRKLEDDLDTLIFDQQRLPCRADADRQRCCWSRGRALLQQADALQSQIAQTAAKAGELELTIVLDAHPALALAAAACGGVLATAARPNRASTRKRWPAPGRACIDGRADLIVGATNDPPSGMGISTQPLFQCRFSTACRPRTHSPPRRSRSAMIC